MSDVIFKGPCKGKTVFFNNGILLAPVHAKHIKQDAWINFQYIDYLVVTGHGTIDGQGSRSWSSSNFDTKRRLPAVRYSF